MAIEDNAPSSQGGVSTTAGGDLTIGGDVVGHDKFIVNQIVLPTGSPASEYSGELRRLVEEEAKKGAPSAKAPPKSRKDYRRELLYRLNLRGTREQISESLGRWRLVMAFASRPAHVQPAATVADGILGIGQNIATTFHSPPIPEIRNCSVECELRIVDDGGDTSRWAGFRVRGFRDDIQFGYLAYLRRQGTVELYRAQEVIGGENQFIIRDTKEAWTKIRLDIVNSTITVWVNKGEKPHISVRDTRFRDNGMVYLHTFGTHAQFRNFSIYGFVRR